VLSTKGWLGSMLSEQVDLQLDLCADVTLLSEQLYLLMKDAPPLKRGLKLKLYQLTNKNS
jgi:hypothetical protein